jgi:hypothetical protein
MWKVECELVLYSVSPLRFFRVVPTQPTLIVWTFVTVVAIGIMIIVRDPSRSVDIMVPVLLLQLFAASSGFEVPARRGHYDLLLTSGHRRVWIGLVHWTTSITPGVLAWLVLAAVELAASHGAEMRLLASGTCAAMALVSTMPWAITVRLPRFSGGIGWLLVLTLSSSVLSPLSVPGRSASDISEGMRRTWEFLVYPVVFVGRELDVGEGLIAAPALMLALASMLAACRWVSRASVPLEAAQ